MPALVFFIILLIVLFVVYLRLRKVDVLTPSEENPIEILEVSISKINDPTKDIKLAALAAENMFISLHGLLREDSSSQDKLSFEIMFSGTEGIKFYVTAPSDVIRFVESQIYAHHPNASLKVVPDYTSRVSFENVPAQIAELSFSKPYFFPIKTFRDFETDPLSAFTSALSNIKGEEEFWFQIVLKPIAYTWQEEGCEYMNALRDGVTWCKGRNLFETVSSAGITEVRGLLGCVATGLFVNRDPEAEAKLVGKASTTVKLTPTQENELTSIENKLGKVGYSVNMRVLSTAPSEALVTGNMRAFLASLKQYAGVASNSFTVATLPEGKKSIDIYLNRILNDKDAMILNGEELSTIFHFPAAHIETPNISWAYSKKSEPPSNLPKDDCIYVGDTLYRNNRIRFGIRNDSDRLRHMYVVGKSGVGKSTLFQTMIIQDIKNGAGVCMLDPHGETIDKVLEYIPDERVKDVIYIDPSDAERPIGLN